MERDWGAVQGSCDTSIDMDTNRYVEKRTPLTVIILVFIIVPSIIDLKYTAVAIKRIWVLSSIGWFAVGGSRRG